MKKLTIRQYAFAFSPLTRQNYFLCGQVLSKKIGDIMLKYEKKPGLSEMMVVGFFRSKKELVIPDTVDGLKVTTICSRALKHCVNLETVVIPDSVTSIEKLAFEDCFKLKSVTIPENIEEIAWGTFYNCGSLESIKIPDNVRSTGAYTFQGCINLKSIVLPKNTYAIGHYLFCSCCSLESIIIPDKNKRYRRSGFLWLREAEIRNFA